MWSIGTNEMKNGAFVQVAICVENTEYRYLKHKSLPIANIGGQDQDIIDYVNGLTSTDPTIKFVSIITFEKDAGYEGPWQMQLTLSDLYSHPDDDTSAHPGVILIFDQTGNVNEKVKHHKKTKGKVSNQGG